MIQLEDLVALEHRVWSALQTGDAQADLGALAEDFLGVYPSGFATRADHVDQLDDGPTVARFELVDPQVLAISADDALLAYRAEFQRPGQDSPIESMYVSSLWSRRHGRWVNVFSQDTPADTDNT